MIGATIIPIPHTAIASACSRGGKVSIRIACDSGIIAAPAAPCSRRNRTIWLSDCATPHSADGDDEHRDRDDEVALAAEAFGDPAGHRDHDSGRDQVAGDDPRDFIDAGRKAALHVRERDVDDRAVEHLEHGAEHHRERDNPLARGGELMRLGRLLIDRLRGSAHLPILLRTVVPRAKLRKRLGPAVGSSRVANHPDFAGCAV